MVSNSSCCKKEKKRNHCSSTTQKQSDPAANEMLCGKRHVVLRCSSIYIFFLDSPQDHHNNHHHCLQCSTSKYNFLACFPPFPSTSQEIKHNEMLTRSGLSFFLEFIKLCSSCFHCFDSPDEIFFSKSLSQTRNAKVWSHLIKLFSPFSSSLLKVHTCSSSSYNGSIFLEGGNGGS